jgi:hypothetical protein
MDAKITLSFNEEVIRKAKAYADRNNISLSRLIEFLLEKITTSDYTSLEDFPISSWVQEVSEGPAEYNRKTRPRKKMKQEFFEKKKR